MLSRTAPVTDEGYFLKCIELVDRSPSVEPTEIKTREQWEIFEERKWLEAWIAGLHLDQIEAGFRNKLRALRDHKRDG